MENTMPSTVDFRQRAARIVESVLAGLAEEMCLERPHCRWNLDQGWDHAGPHRLDVVIDDTSKKAYFTDDALLAFNDQRAGPGKQLNLRRMLNDLQMMALC